MVFVAAPMANRRRRHRPRCRILRHQFQDWPDEWLDYLAASGLRLERLRLHPVLQLGPDEIEDRPLDLAAGPGRERVILVAIVGEHGARRAIERRACTFIVRSLGR